MAWSRSTIWLLPSRRVLLQSYGLLQRQILRRSPHEERVVPRHELPAILLDVEDGQKLRIHFHADFFALAAVELYFAPADKPFGRLVSCGRKGCVDFCDFGSCPAASTGDGE